MTEKEFTPEQQLKRIEEMVFEARLRFEENGFAFILWGITIALASFTQAYLIHIEQYSVSWYPYLAMPLVGLFTYWYFAKKRSKTKKRKNRSILFTPGFGFLFPLTSCFWLFSSTESYKKT